MKTVVSYIVFSSIGYGRSVEESETPAIEWSLKMVDPSRMDVNSALMSLNLGLLLSANSNLKFPIHSARPIELDLYLCLYVKEWSIDRSIGWRVEEKTWRYKKLKEWWGQEARECKQAQLIESRSLGWLISSLNLLWILRRTNSQDSSETMISLIHTHTY